MAPPRTSLLPSSPVTTLALCYLCVSSLYLGRYCPASHILLVLCSTIRMVTAQQASGCFGLFLMVYAIHPNKHASSSEAPQSQAHSGAPPKARPGPRSSHRSLPMSSRSLRTSGGVFGDRARYPLLHYTASQLSMCFFIQLKGWFITVGTEPWGTPREGASRAERQWVFTPISA